MRFKKDNPDYQVLCSNCNTSKQRNNGTCEHATEKKNASWRSRFVDALGSSLKMEPYGGGKAQGTWEDLKNDPGE